jgi:hypothetical protein
MNRHLASSSRRRLLDAARQVLAAAGDLVTERGPLLHGAFQLRGTRCGKENCKCNQGELHTTAVLIVSEDGKRRSYYVRPPDRPEIQRRVERYLRRREQRGELGKLGSECLAAADELIEALAEPHRPDRDHAARRRRGKVP